MNIQTIGTFVKIGVGIFAAAILLFALAELVSSFLLPDPPVDRAPLVQVAPHPVLGYALVPNQKTFSYQAKVYTNAAGLRVPLLETATVGASRVIVFLGGSEVFGKGVAAEEAFPKLVEAELRGSVAVNAGVPDYNIDQSVLWLDRYGAPYAPSVVVLTFYWNDLFADPSIDREANDNEEWAPRTVLKRTGLLAKVAPLYTRSRIAYVARNALKTAVGRWRDHPEQRWRDALLRGESLPEIEAAWRRVGSEVARFSALARQRGFVPLIVALPIEQAIEDGIDNDFGANVARLGERHGVRVVDATERLRDAVSRGERPYIPWDGRPSVAGHQAIADAVLEVMRGM